jgi:hypothetical protein
MEPSGQIGNPCHPPRRRAVVENPVAALWMPALISILLLPQHAAVPAGFCWLVGLETRFIDCAGRNKGDFLRCESKQFHNQEVTASLPRGLLFICLSASIRVHPRFQ